MLSKRVVLILILFLSYLSIQAQCDCTNCPWQTISNATVTDTIWISGATSNTLGAGGQDLQKICINFIDDAIREKEITLKAPDGSTVKLALNSGLNSGQNVSFDICWVACAEPAIPEPGFNPVFSTGDPWIQNTSYGGCYYPWLGCLEDLTGPVDGPWVLIIQDHIGLDDATIFDWSLGFYNDGGLNCATNGPCTFVLPPCLADGGDLTTTMPTFCENDPGLIMSLPPTYPGGTMAPPITDYGYLYVVTNTSGVIVSIGPTINLVGTGPGNYSICGLSYLLSDFPLLPTANGTNTFVQLENDIINSVFCADLSTTCELVTITAGPPTPQLMGNPIVCTGSTEIYNLTPPLGPGESYIVSVAGGTVVSLVGSVLTVQWGNISGPGNICVEITNGSCTGPKLTVGIIIDQGYTLPPTLTGNTNVCLGSTEIVSIPTDPAIISYQWSGTGITILNMGTPNELHYNPNMTGPVQVCLSVNTACGTVGPLCLNINVVPGPDPMILPFGPTCDFNFNLTAVNSSAPGAWTVVSGPGTVVFNPATSPMTNVTVSGPGSYVFNYSENNGTCIGMDEITVVVSNDLIVSPAAFVCNAQNEYTVAFTILTGQAPYLVNNIPLVGSNYTSGLIPSGDPYSFTVMDVGGCTVTVSGSHMCPCTSDAGTMSSSLLEVCDGPGDFATAISNGDFVLDSDDTGNFVLHDGATNVLGTIWAQNNTGEFSYVSGMAYNTTYYISLIVGNDLAGLVDLNDPCLSVSIGQPVIFYQTPSGTLSSDQIGCVTDFNLEILNELGTTLNQWSLLSGPGTAVFSTATAPSTTVSVSAPGIYSFGMQLINPGCSTFESIMVVVGAPPQVSMIVEDCDMNGASYIVSFEINGATPPLTANVPGNFVGNVFTSDPILSGVPYSIIITDASGCSTAAITGVKLCDCVTASGNMDLTPIEVCGTLDSIQAIHQGNQILDGDDLALYYLHDNMGNVLGTVYDINDTGYFGFNAGAGMLMDTWYYVSLVVGNSLGASIDLTDPCLGIASGQAVRWVSFPMVNAGADVTICEDSLLLSASPINGNWMDPNANVNVTLSSTTDPMATSYFSVPGNYTLLWVTTGQCSALDSINVEYAGVPMITNTNVECSADLLSYIYSFEIVGNGPFMVNGDLLTGTGYVSGPLPIGVVSSFNIIDVNNCESNLEAGPVNCACDNDPGTVDQADIQLCQGEDLVFNISNLDYLLGTNDTLEYILHDGSSAPLGIILASSYGTTIPYPAGVIAGQDYFLNLVIGDSIAMGIDLSDPCLAVSESVIVNWSAPQEISLSGNHQVCVGEDVDLVIESMPPYPFNITLQSLNGMDVIVDLNGPIETVTLNALNNDTWTLVDDPDDCYVTLGEAVIETQEMTVVELTTGITICNSPDQPNTIALNDLFVGMPVMGTWDLGSLNIVGDSIQFEGVSSGSYSVSFSTVGFDNNCPGSFFFTELTVEECNCPMLSFSDIYLCNNDAYYDLGFLDVFGWMGTWSIQNASDFTTPITQNGSLLDLTDKSPGAYLMFYQITDPVPANCPVDSYEFILNLEAARSAGDQIDFSTYCFEEDTSIDLHDLLDAHSLDGNWTYQGAIISSNINVNTLDTGRHNFKYVLAAGVACEGDSTELTLDIEPNPEFDLDVSDVLCYGQANGVISIQVSNDDNGPFVCYLDDLIQDGNKLIDSLPPGLYDVSVEDINGCVTTVSDVLISEPAAISVNLGPDQNITLGDELEIEAILSLLGADVSGFTWSDLEGVLDEDQLKLVKQFLKNNIISIEVVDENGCITTDEIEIRVLIKSIYVPNTFNPNSTVGNELFGLTLDSGVELIQEFSIFDRWGGRMFHVENIDPNEPSASWNGRVNNQAVEQGVYVYLMRLRYPNGAEEIRTGDITVLRGG